MSLCLEALLTSPHGFGLTAATPMQRAICRIADGLPLGDLAQHPDVLRAIGDTSILPPGVRPAELLVLSGIRAGKSLLAAALAVRAALTCDLSRVRTGGEHPRVSVVSLTRDLAQVVYQHLRGAVLSSPALRAMLAGDPTSDTLTLRHPSGRPVELKVVAGAKAGASLVARWSAGCIFDEAPRMNGEAEGVVNYDDARRAVLGRLLPGAQLIAVGSPWAPRGPIYEAVLVHWRRPSAQCVVVRAPAPAMNPAWWTPARIAALELSDPAAYRTDVLGEFADPESALIPSAHLERATRPWRSLPPAPGHSYLAAMDPATRGNAWTLLVLTRRRGGDGRVRAAVVLARQWQGRRDAPLDPGRVLLEIRAALVPYGLEHCYTDQLAADYLRALAADRGLALSEDTITASRKLELYDSMRARLADDALELPDEPLLRADLQSVRRRLTAAGAAIDLPVTADGRHADYAAALSIALGHPLADPPPLPPTPASAAERARRDADALEQLAIREPAVDPEWEGELVA